MRRRTWASWAIGGMVTVVAGRAERRETARFAQDYNVTARVLDVEVVNGPVTVVVGKGTGWRVEADVEYRGAAEEDIALAKEEVKFAPRVEGDVFRVWVERRREGGWNRYQARHAVTVRAPEGVKVLARTVNGAVKVDWAAGPRAEAYLKTINGEVELGFGRAPDADFRLRTRNGQIYTAFELAPLADLVQTEEQSKVTAEGMRRIVSRTSYTGGRAGRGGPRIEAETVNGQIRLVERK